jgi:signal transduction histidine kinase
MELEVDDRLTLSYLSKLERENYLALAAVVLLSAAGLFGLLFRLGGNNDPYLVSNIMYPLTSFVGAIWAFFTSFRSRYGPLKLQPSRQLAWLLVGLGILANGLGSVYFTYMVRTGQTVLVPSLADVGFTLFYPLVFFGIFLMPESLKFRSGIALDALITTLCILGVSWFFFISKVFVVKVESNVTQAELITTVSYPVWDMLLMLAVVLLIFRRSDTLLYPSLILLGVGILAQIWADTGYAYTSAVGTYDAVDFLIDPFWCLGFLLIGLSGLYQYTALVRRAYNKQEFPTQTSKLVAIRQTGQSSVGSQRWRCTRGTLIFLPLAILLALTLYDFVQAFRNNQTGSLFLLVLTFIVGVLVTVRSLLATRENDRLLQALSKAYAQQETIAIERMHLYEELQEKQEQLVQAGKLATLGELTTGVAHELNNPLNNIGLFIGNAIDLIELGMADPHPERIIQELHYAMRQVHKATEIISHLRTFGRATVVSREPVGILQVIRRSLSLVQEQLRLRQIEVNLHFPEEEVVVMGNAIQLEQIFINLLTNARDALAQSTRKVITIECTRRTNDVEIRFCDTGTGIPVGLEQRIFDPFFTTKEVGAGTGLGLSITYGIIKEHHGTIEVENGPSGGALFLIQLPFIEMKSEVLLHA